MVFRISLFCVLLFATAPALQAQVEKYNPYAPVVEEPPIRADGKINWPAYFKAARMEEKYNSFFQSGSCVGTGKRVTGKLAANKVDVNSLPRITLQSQAVTTMHGVVAAVAQDGKPVDVFTHPKGVSQVTVTGEIPASAVVAGLVVRFQGAVDSHAKGVEPIGALEVISNTPDLKPIEVKADHEQTILGRVEKHQRGQLVVNVGVGSLRKLTFSLPETTPVNVNGSTLDLVGPGDVLEAEGPVYSGENGDRSLFAEKLTVHKGLRKNTKEVN